MLSAQFLTTTKERTMISQIAPVHSHTANTSDIGALRKRAIASLTDGTVTDGYGANHMSVVELMSGALAAALIWVVRHKRYFITPRGICYGSAKTAFLGHADEEMLHANWFANTIVELGSEPDFPSDGLRTRGHAKYVEGTTFSFMIRANLIAERTTIESSRELIAYLGHCVPVT
jgi:bacterioferritin